MPDEPKVEHYRAQLTKKPQGSYNLAIQLFDKKSGEPVEIGLSKGLEDDSGYFKMVKVMQN